MTPRQVYTALAKIAGHKCYDGKRFIQSQRIGEEHRKIIQRRLLTLMEKIDYVRCLNDFPGIYMNRSMREMEGALVAPTFSPPVDPGLTGALSDFMRQSAQLWHTNMVDPDA